MGQVVRQSELHSYCFSPFGSWGTSGKRRSFFGSIFLAPQCGKQSGTRSINTHPPSLSPRDSMQFKLSEYLPINKPRLHTPRSSTGQNYFCLSNCKKYIFFIHAVGERTIAKMKSYFYTECKKIPTPCTVYAIKY
jgi:hypothetical protein